MVSTLISLVIWLVVIGVIFWLLLYLIDNLPLAPPFNQVARTIVIVVGCIVLILVLLQFAGLVGGEVPRLR